MILVSVGIVGVNETVVAVVGPALPKEEDWYVELASDVVLFDTVWD